MIILSRKTAIIKIDRMNNRQKFEKPATFYTYTLATNDRPRLLVPELAAGGKPST